MLKLSVQNVGQAPVTLKDVHGYTTFVMDVAPSTTKTQIVQQDLLERITAQLQALETPITTSAGAVLVGIRWSVLSDDAIDDRALTEGLAGLPSLNELQAANYSTGAGATAAVATGTGLLGNQTKASLKILEGTARIDLEAVAPGTPGNALSAEVITPASTLDISVSGSKIVIRPASGGSTVADIVSAINADTDAKFLVQATLGVAGTVDAAVAEAPLRGGMGPGVSLTLGGTACALSEVSDTQLTFDIPSGISAASRIAPLEYRNGPHISRLSVPVAA